MADKNIILNHLKPGVDRQKRTISVFPRLCLSGRLTRTFVQIVFLGTVFFFGSGSLLYAQGTKSDITKLLSIIQKMQQLPVYQYETETNAVYPNGQKDKMTTRLFVNRTERMLCYQTTNQVLIINNKWIYNADLFNKTISILSKSKYQKYKNQLPNPDDLFNGQAIKKLMDSTVLKKATVKHFDVHGDLMTFRLGFPEGFYITEFIMVYNTKTALPQIIRFKVRYSDGKAADGTAKVTNYETVCKNYQIHVSKDAFDTGKYFVIKDGKVKLLQYKNYTVSAVL